MPFTNPRLKLRAWRSRQIRHFTPLRLEALEERCVLSTGLFFAQIDGLPDTSDYERVAAAATLFHSAGLTDSQVLAIGVVDPNESILIQTPVSAKLKDVVQELLVVPGFLAVDEFRLDGSGGNEEEEDEEGPGNGADVNVGRNGFEPTIAVNPNNLNNIVVAQGANLRISNDGGATFPIQRTRVLPSGQTSDAGDDSVAFDAQGRLFWTYLTRPGNYNIVSLQVNPTTGVPIGSPIFVAQGSLDKEWLAADRNPSSPFANNLYSVWADLSVNGHPIHFSRSTNQGAPWNTLGGTLSGPGEGAMFGSEVAVAPNGDVWAAWHTHIYDETGTAEEVRMRRSTDSGLNFGPELIPFPAGTADATTNEDPPRISGLRSIQIASLQPRILIDPVRCLQLRLAKIGIRSTLPIQQAA